MSKSIYILGFHSIESLLNTNPESVLKVFIQNGRKDIRVNVGSGFTDDNRTVFWTGRNDLIGWMVEVRADAVTQNQDGTYSLRFPRFKTFRGFEIGEKI